MSQPNPGGHCTMVSGTSRYWESNLPQLGWPYLSAMAGNRLIHKLVLAFAVHQIPLAIVHKEHCHG